MTEFLHGDWDEDEVLKSKTQVKREMDALQQLGEELVALPPASRAKVPLDEELRDALLLADKLAKKREALRRHIQFIGRLMRSRDIEPIEQALALIRNTNQAATRKFHLVEQWRDRLLTEKDAVTAFVAEYPEVDVQQLRQLIRQAQKEQQKQQPPKAYRELFQLLRPFVTEAE
ncbi:ribosome biogenesis factor YjgA [Alkalimonas delamerensis]|uniref:Dual-action ribosomal maturation protein DarP n=1 Tax=Alkalimonas delamerensis TaxID=265981 RepID=A0ABT9GPZ9_9GAMM|nr:ribosome biogenesis factor YjgA [Alkalimonas delamerensis]MDP4529053.1 ribosome biogenesis factor YjgA [Alkalimonas delamerensis]